MKRLLSLLAVFLSLILPVGATVLEGQVSYTVESARKIAFEGIERSIDPARLESHMQDPDYKENKQVMKGKMQLNNRSVQVFKGFVVPAYAVTYYDNPRYTYYYIKCLNQLAFVDIDEVDVTKEPVQFPFKTYRYDFKGRLLAVGLTTSVDERFLYKSNGKLISHWVGNIGYNAKGKKIGSVEVRNTGNVNY